MFITVFERARHLSLYPEPDVSNLHLSTLLP